MRKRFKEIIVMLLILCMIAGMITISPTENVNAMSLSNPRKDSNGNVTYDCVWFGSYPQSDATGVKKDPIKWRVLEVNGNDAFLVADCNLDVRRYNDTDTYMTWETCTMRKWLNSDFLNKAFTGSEQSAIKTTTVVNADNPYEGTKGGNNTQDKVFLLSLDEVMNEKYGFSSDYGTCDKARQRKSTAYVAKGGISGMSGEGSAGFWWLRSPGYFSFCAASVNNDGRVDRVGRTVYYGYYAVCPALHLNLASSNLYSYAGTVCSDGTVNEEGGGTPIVPGMDKTTIQYGGSSATLGNEIKGTTGMTIDTLLVLGSNRYEIADLNVTPEDNSMLEVVSTDIGSGDYITSENEKKAVVHLKLKKVGSTNITITAPDGTSVTVPVTVVKSSNTFIENFDKDIYTANVLVNNRAQYALDYYEKDFTDPSKIMVDALKANSKFRHSVVAWEVANAITSVNLDANVDREINIVSYYEAIIFSLCQNTIESDTFIDTFASSEAISSIKLTKSIDSFINSYEKADITYDKTLTKQQKSDLIDDLKKQNKDYLNGYIGAATSIIDYSKDINQFYKTLSKYEAISNTSKELLPILKTIRANSSDKYINAALDRVIKSMESQFGTLLTAIELGTYQIYDWAANEVTSMLVNELITSNPIVKTLKTAAAIGKSISNFAFSTDATVDQYYAMQCLENFRIDIKNALAITYKNYVSNRTSENAKNYLLSINVLFNSYDLGCEYASGLGKIIYEKALIGKAFYGKSKTYEDYKKSIQTIQTSLTLQLNSINKYWAFNLLDDCPELFETVAQAIQLHKIDTLDSTMIRLSGLNFDYTGKEINPKVYICANGEYLKEGEDFTLSYKNNVQPGMASVTVTSTNKYYPGTVTRYFMINDDDFVTEYNIRDNGRPKSSSIFSKAAFGLNTLASTADFSVSVYDGENLVAQVIGGVIIENELPVIVDNDNIIILMNDKKYDIRYASTNGRNIDVNVSAYNHEKEIENTVSYNNLNISALTECENSITLGTNEIDSVMINDGTEIVPSFASSNVGSLTQYTISAKDCVVSKTKAYPGEVVWVKAVVPETETFKGWNTTLSGTYTLETFSFVMPNGDVSIAAKYECNHDNTTLINARSASCTEEGYTGDLVCDICGETIEEGTIIAAYGHTYNRVVTKEPTINSEGIATFTCGHCGDSYTEMIPKLDGESNTSEEITTTKPSVAQEMTTSKVTSSDKITTSIADTQETKANVVKKPKPTKIKKIKKAKRSLKVIWKKIKGVSGYQIQYSTSSKFKKAKKVTIRKAKTTSKTIKKLQAKKKYYVRIRTYIVINGKKKYSNWSKRKSQKTK